MVAAIAEIVLHLGDVEAIGVDADGRQLGVQVGVPGLGPGHGVGVGAVEIDPEESLHGEGAEARHGERRGNAVGFRHPFDDGKDLADVGAPERQGRQGTDEALHSGFAVRIEADAVGFDAARASGENFESGIPFWLEP